jgi:hypothetical protein
MKINNDSEWPNEMDALVAAPEHHKLLFENDHVRVLDTLIPPGEITRVHTHKWSATQYILSGSDFIRYDAEGNILVDSRTLSEKPAPSSARWSEPLKPHALKNIGMKDIHVISVEVKNLAS